MSGNTGAGVASWPRYALPHGTTVNGYTIERVLGSGGFGVTYLARDALGQLFAVKEFYPREFATRQELAVLASSDDHTAVFDDCLNRFRHEAQALVRLSRTSGTGDGVVRVVTYFTAHGTGYLVMEYVEGATLASVLRQTPKGLPAERVTSLLSQLLSSVGAVHQAGLLHRDIKPANIILRDDGRVVLIDFGSSRETASGLTRTYTQIYSTGYAPLEQMMGLRQGPFSDIYAIGAVCYQAIGGEVMDALTRHNAQSSGRPDPQRPAAQIGAGRYPERLLKAIDAALAINPDQRPQNVDALLAMLDAGVPNGDTTVVSPSSRRAVPPTQPNSPALSARPRRGGWTVAVFLGALAVAAAAVFVRYDLDGSNRMRQEAARQQELQQEAATRAAANLETARLEAETAKREAAKQEAARQTAARQAADDATKTCDLLSASPDDKTRPAGVAGVRPGRIDPQGAIPACERAVAYQPSPRLQFQLGRSYDAAARFADAARLYKLAADQEHVSAQYNLGMLYEAGHGVLQSWAEAARLYKLAAGQGLAAAQSNLGWLYEIGRGVPQSPSEAARLYKLAADQGDASAQYDLGRLYDSGLGVPQSWAVAEHYYRLAAAQDNQSAKIRLQQHQ